MPACKKIQSSQMTHLLSLLVSPVDGELLTSVVKELSRTQRK